MQRLAQIAGYNLAHLRGFDPEVVELALRGLLLTKPDVVISRDVAVVLGNRHHGDAMSRFRTKPL